MLALALLSLSVQGASARALLQKATCQPVANRTGDTIAVVPTGFFSVILAPYQNAEVPAKVFIFGSEKELSITDLGGQVPAGSTAAPGNVMCWLKNPFISIQAADTFLDNTDYSAVIDHHGEQIDIVSDSRCTTGHCKQFTDEAGNVANSCHVARCVLGA